MSAFRPTDTNSVNMNANTNMNSEVPMDPTEAAERVIADPDTCPYGCCETVSVMEHILKEGLFKGACSDITLLAFGSEYKLHKLILSQSGYFSSLLTGPWSDIDSHEHELRFDHDSFITKEAFDTVIEALYGNANIDKSVDALNMIAISQYLDIPHIVCSSTDSVVNSMDFSTIAGYSKFALRSNYGKASDRIVDCAKGFLCSNGWQAGVKAWDGIPVSVIASVLGSDCFFVPSEWERAIFIIRLLERRQKMYGADDTDDDEDELDPVIEVLNTRVYYCHLTAEQLHRLEDMKNTNGAPYVDPGVLRNALWQSIQLHKKVATADKKSQDLGLAANSETPPDSISSWFVPTKDETLYGTPDVLDATITQHHLVNNDIIPSGKTTEKHTVEGVSSEHALGQTMLYKVTKIPPFRFSIAFSGVSELEADKRVYAKTLWYAGSYWNLYIQKIRHRKGFQMGVYIHRASSCAPSRSGLLNRDLLDPSLLSPNLDDDEYEIDLNIDIDKITRNLANARLHDDNSTTTSGSRSSFNLHSGIRFHTLRYAANDLVEAEDDLDGSSRTEDDNSFLRYEDDRTKTSVYYIIYTPSRKVTSSLTCFISTPDLFNKSQSWGWKSNSMCSFNEDGTLADGQDKLLKFMVVVGNT